jgi:hypothetical protein
LARRISVEIVGNAASLERSFGRASRSAGVFHRDLNKATRGALSGSGVMSHLGRSLAFASGGFLAFATIGGALRSSIDAAVDAAATQRQLAAQLKASGLSYKNYRGEIDQTNLHLSALSGFTKNELDQSFTTIVRGTGNVNKALKDTALAADIARGRHISLSTASVAVGKAAAGSTTALKRLGIQLPKGATGAEALAKATRLFGGQAAAGATAQQKFAAVLHDSEVIIGTALLPTLTRWLTKGTIWLDQMNRSGHLQRDVAAAARFLSHALHGVEAIVVPVAHAFRALSHAVGGSKNAVEILGGTFAAWKIAGILLKVGRLAKAFRGLAFYEEAAAAASGGIHPRGIPGMVGKAGKIGLGAGLLTAAEIAVPVAGFAALAYASRDHKAPKGYHYVQGRTARSPVQLVKDAPSGPLPAAGAHGGGGGLAGAISARRRSPRGGGAPGVSLQGRFNMADYALAQAGMTKSQADDRRALATEASITREQMAQAKTLKDKTKYAQQLAGIVSQIQGIDDASASAAADKRKARAEKQRAAREKAAAFAVPMSLQLAQAKADAIAAGTGSQDMTKGQISAAKAIRTAAIKAIHSHRLNMQGLIDAWNEVSSINSQLAGQAGAKGLKATYHHASTKAITAGLGLTRDQAVAVRERAAQAEAHRGFKPSGPAAQGQPIHIEHFHSHARNTDQLYSELEKVGRRRGQRRGTR